MFQGCGGEGTTTLVPCTGTCFNPDEKWKGDGWCDDEINVKVCNFDDGDCCGNNVKKTYCTDCKCKGSKSRLKSSTINKAG